MSRLMVLFLFILQSTSALACAVCGFNSQSRGAFVGTAVLMTLVPLSFMGGVTYYVYRKIKAQRLEDASADSSHGA